MRLVVNPEKQSDAQEGERDWNVREPGHDERPATATNVLRRQHPLDHVLIGAVSSHGDEDGTDQAGKNRVFGFEHGFPPVPSALGRIETGRDEIGEMEISPALNDLVPAAGYGEVKKCERGQC